MQVDMTLMVVAECSECGEWLEFSHDFEKCRNVLRVKICPVCRDISHEAGYEKGRTDGEAGG